MSSIAFRTTGVCETGNIGPLVFMQFTVIKFKYGRKCYKLVTKVKNKYSWKLMSEETESCKQ